MCCIKYSMPLKKYKSRLLKCAELNNPKILKYAELKMPKVVLNQLI